MRLGAGWRELAGPLSFVGEVSSGLARSADGGQSEGAARAG